MGLADEVQAGITYPREHNLVSDIECREAAKYCNYNYQQFIEDLDSSERAACIAQYRMHYIIEGHVAQASKSASEIRSARSGQLRRMGR